MGLLLAEVEVVGVPVEEQGAVVHYLLELLLHRQQTRFQLLLLDAVAVFIGLLELGVFG